MPRKPDASLEAAILDSALSLLDEEGFEAVKMREVAKGAQTTTPTLYERFRDRDALLWAVVARIQSEIYQHAARATSLQQMAEVVVEYLCSYPGRLDLMSHHWPQVMSSNRPKPAFDLAKARLMAEGNRSAEVAEELAYSLTALLFGAAIFMRTAGAGSEVSRQVKSSSLKAVEILCRA